MAFVAKYMVVLLTGEVNNGKRSSLKWVSKSSEWLILKIKDLFVSYQIWKLWSRTGEIVQWLRRLPCMQLTQDDPISIPGISYGTLRIARSDYLVQSQE